jgi:ferrochelatase
MKTGVLLVNLGTPDSPKTKDVRKYLTQFLNDPRVIDIAPLARLLLVNLIIVPFRSPKSAKLYSEIWTPEGSPLLTYTKKVSEKLQEKLGSNYVVDFAMRYQKPSLENTLAKFQKLEIKKLKVIPLYPQYASSSTGSSLQKVLEIVSKWEVIPELEMLSEFFENPKFIDTIVDIASAYPHKNYDHVLFSFHGLPERHLRKGDKSGTCLASKNCCDTICQSNYYCYRAEAFQTARLIAQKLDIPAEKYTVSFQSRLGRDPWIKPYSDEVIVQKAKEGVKKILVFSPAFVADCLETIHEIGVEYQELFHENGGEKIQLVESLNLHPKWIETLQDLVLAKP